MENIHFKVSDEVYESWQQLAQDYNISLLQILALGPTILLQLNKIDSNEIVVLDSQGEVKDKIKLPQKKPPTF